MSRKKLILWAVSYAAGLLTIWLRMDILPERTALMAAGSILAVVSGTGLLLELFRYRKSR